MAKFRCLYCGIRLDRASAQVRLKHMKGKKHQKCVSDYWAAVGKRIKASEVSNSWEALDQSLDIARSYLLPGLDQRADELLDSGKVPAPANIPSPAYPHAHLG